MDALLADGPMAQRHIWIDEPAPDFVTVETPDPDDTWQPIAAGEEYPEAKVVSHTYRKIGVDKIPSAPSGSDELAIYMHVPELAHAA